MCTLPRISPFLWSQFLKERDKNAWIKLEVENELFVLRNASREMRGGFLSHFDEKPAHVFCPKFALQKNENGYVSRRKG